MLGAGVPCAGLTGTGGSVEFALTLGRPLIVEPGGAAFAFSTVLSVDGTPFALLGGFCVFVRDRRMFRRRSRSCSASSCFSVAVTAWASASWRCPATSSRIRKRSRSRSRRRVSTIRRDSEQHQHEHDDDGDNDGDYGSR